MVVIHPVRGRPALLLCALLLLSAATLAARGRSEPAAAPAGDIPEVGSFPVPLLFVFSYNGTQHDEDGIALLRDSAAAAFASRRPSARLLIDSGGSEQARDRAIERGAIGWVELSVSESGGSAEIAAAAYATAAIGPLFQLSYEEPAPLSGPRLRRAWEPAAARFDESYEALVLLALAEVRYTPVTLRAVPGTWIEGLGEGTRVVPDSGVLQLQLRAPLVYSATARATGYYPVERMILVLEEEIDLELDQPPRSAYSYDLGLANAAYPSVEVARRIDGDYLFVRGGLTTYLIGMIPFGDDDDRPSSEEDRLFTGENLTVLGLQLGRYLHSPYGRVRAYAGAGVLWRLIHSRGYWGSDPLAPWGVGTTLGVESRPSERWRLFLEWQPALYRTDYPEILLRRLPGGVQLWPKEQSAEDGFFFTGDPEPAWVLSGASFRLGVRWQP